MLSFVLSSLLSAPLLAAEGEPQPEYVQENNEARFRYSGAVYQCFVENDVRKPVKVTLRTRYFGLELETRGKFEGTPMADCLAEAAASMDRVVTWPETLEGDLKLRPPMEPWGEIRPLFDEAEWAEKSEGLELGWERVRDVSYPSEASSMRMVGKCRVQMTIDTEGIPRDLIGQECHVLFAEPMMRALSRSQATVAVVDGEPVPWVYVQPIEFRIGGVSP